MTRRVILCLITIVVNLALRDNAFDAETLDRNYFPLPVCAERVFQIKNIGPVKCTPIRFKESMMKIPIFRRYEGSVLSSDRAMLYAKLRDDMSRQSLDAGEEQPVKPKAFRRMAANETNGKFELSCHWLDLVLTRVRPQETHRTPSAIRRCATTQSGPRLTQRTSMRWFSSTSRMLSWASQLRMGWSSSGRT